MIPRSGRRKALAPAPCGRRPKTAEDADPRTGSEEAAATPRANDRDEIVIKAARLGITPERILQEYARIAFADLRRIADWGPDGLVLRTPEALSDEDVAAIAEIVSSGVGRNCRIKLYDKKSALDALARHLGMFVRAAHRPGHVPDVVAEDAREVLARRLARLAAGGAEE